MTSSPPVAQFLREPVGDRKAEPSEQLRQRDVRFVVEGLEQGLRPGIHLRISATFSPSKALGLIVFNDLTEEAFLLVEPVNGWNRFEWRIHELTEFTIKKSYQLSTTDKTDYMQ